MKNYLKTFKNTAVKSKKKNSKLFNKKPKIFIKSKYQKRYQLFSDFRYVSSSFKFSKIKFYKKRIQVLKKYYSYYTGLNKKLFNNIIKDSLRKSDFLIERRLDIFLCRNFGGSLVQKRKEILGGKILVNGSVKSGNYLLQNNDFIY
jgi:ribosomal protein S4